MSLEKKERPFYRAMLGVSPRSIDVEVEKAVGLISIHNEKTQGLRLASTMFEMLRQFPAGICFILADTLQVHNLKMKEENQGLSMENLTIKAAGLGNEWWLEGGRDVVLSLLNHLSNKQQPLLQNPAYLFGKLKSKKGNYHALKENKRAPFSLPEGFLSREEMSQLTPEERTQKVNEEIQKCNALMQEMGHKFEMIRWEAWKEEGDFAKYMEEFNEEIESGLEVAQVLMKTIESNAYQNKRFPNDVGFLKEESIGIYCGIYKRNQEAIIGKSKPTQYTRIFYPGTQYKCLNKAQDIYFPEKFGVSSILSWHDSSRNKKYCEEQIKTLSKIKKHKETPYTDKKKKKATSVDSTNPASSAKSLEFFGTSPLVQRIDKAKDNHKSSEQSPRVPFDFNFVKGEIEFFLKRESLDFNKKCRYSLQVVKGSIFSSYPQLNFEEYGHLTPTVNQTFTQIQYSLSHALSDDSQPSSLEDLIEFIGLQLEFLVEAIEKHIAKSETDNDFRSDNLPSSDSSY